jgi:pimeloyl-ACP methyl ester carboxylesterase
MTSQGCVLRPWLAPAVWVACALLAPARAALQTALEPGAALEPVLAPGPFPVGFRSTWASDEGRTYRTAFDEGRTYGAEKAPRPVLVQLWYPARAADTGARMTHGEYFDLAAREPRVAALAKATAVYALGVLVQQVFGEPESGLDDEERAELELLLAEPTGCVRGAEPAEGPFPLVVYHSGAGSSFEDNARLCEFLASHGYVVLGSSFLEADGSGLGIDAERGSAEDAQFLVRWARSLSFADWRRVALVGHSAGAQAWLRFAAQPACVADALVLLDTTQDYYGPSLPLHEALVREVGAGVAHLTRPLLVAAGPDAVFALCDTLVQAERTYLTMPDLGHDEYISQGLQRLERLARRAAEGRPADPEELARMPGVRASYRTLCESVRSFLDAALGRGAADFDARLALARERPWSDRVACLVRAPRGASGPEPYDLDSPVPPTPRQFARLMKEQGAAIACEVLERFRGLEPRGPLYTSTMLAGSLLHGLAAEGRKDEAALYYATLRAIPLRALGLFEFLADISTMQGKTEQALEFLRLACELDPADRALAAKLRALEAPSGR